MSEELKWPKPDSYAVMAFGVHQKLVVREDVAEEWASKYREQGFINVSVVPLFTYAQTCELVASLRSELEAARGKVEALKKLATNFQINGPDADGLAWLILHGSGTTGQAMFNLGDSKRLATQVALHLEADRKAALAAAPAPNT